MARIFNFLSKNYEGLQGIWWQNEFFTGPSFWPQVHTWGSMPLTWQNLEIKCHLVVEFGANGSNGCNFWIMLSNVGHECGKEHGLMPHTPIFFFYLWKYFGRNFGKFEWDNFLSYTISKTYAVFEQALFVNEKCLLIFWQNFQFRVIVVPVYWLENCIHVNSNCCSHISWLSYVLGYLLLLSLYISSLHFSNSFCST